MTDSDLRQNDYEKAFTLAEVLITLGIIGVVAAMTIPNLISNHRAKVLHTRLLRADAIIQQAAMRAKADEVNLEEVINQERYAEFEIYFKNGQCKLPKNAQEANYKNYTGKYYAVGAAHNKLVHSYCLFDGMTLWFGKQVLLNGAFLAVDINGWTEKPNKYGHDVFFWYYNPETQMLAPIGTGIFKSGGFDYYDDCPGKKAACEQGISCTYKAIHDKNYFKNLP